MSTVTALPEPATRSASAGGRILPIDAARGLVMLFSCLSHFAWWIHAVHPEASATLAGIGMVATPTFLMISGAMVGMLCATGRSDRDLKSQLFNRGLFLLTVGHLAIALSEAHLSGLARALSGITVVDEIGLCTLLAAFLVPKLADANICSRAARVAGFVLCAAWLVNIYWLPTDTWSVATEQLLIGGTAGADPALHTPVLQHIALYVLGLPLGHLLSRFVRQKVTLERIAHPLALTGSVLVSTAALLHFARSLLWNDASIHPAMDFTLTITQKLPPSPAYLLFFGGCGLLLIAMMFAASASTQPLVRAAVESVAVIGRASLFIFVLQYFLYWTLPDLLDVHPDHLAALVFIGNVLLIRCAAGLWDRLRGNRWLTFGIKLPAAAKPA